MPTTPIALVTGCSSGVGLAAAEAIARRGVRVVGTVRSDADAAMVAERFAVLGLDVSTDHLDVTDAKAAEEVIARHRPDVLVNNAGTADFAPVLEVGDDDAEATLRLLTLAPIRLARLAAQAMVARGSGRIVTVSSALATVPLPTTGWYAASKAAVSSLTDVLRVELAGTGVDVVRVELGAIDTPIWDDAAHASRYAKVTERARPLFSDVVVAADAIAEAACAKRPRALYRAGFGAQALSVVARLPAVARDPILRAALT
jgi:short-subunit dehydrogenase